MKNLFLSVVLLLTVSFAFANNEVEKVSTFNVEEVSTINLENSLSFTFSSLETLQKFDFNSFLNKTGLENGQCTVTVSVSYSGVSASFSVTADTCQEAGAGAVSAAMGFVKQIKEMM